MKIPAQGAVYEGAVPFHDCDPLGIVWHGNYYKYLEIARTELLKGYRLDVADFMALGYRLLMIETRCRHAFPLEYGDRFSVRAWVMEHDMRLKIGYEVKNLTHGGRRAAKAWTTLICTDAGGTMLFEVPGEVQARIAMESTDE